MFVVLSLLLSHASAADCPVVVCADIADNSCAEIVGTTVHLRSKHCDTTTYCNLTAVLQSSGNQVIPCLAFNDSETIYDDNDYRDCGKRIYGRNLASGRHPKVCSSENDCVLEDGTKSSCQCGVNGFAYCAPDLNSRLFNQYWSNCLANADTVYRNDYYYWTWYLQYYPLIVSAPSCAWSVSIELLTFRYLDAFLYQGAADRMVVFLCVMLAYF